MKQFLPLIFALTLLVGCGPEKPFDDVHVEINTSLPLGGIKFSDSTLFALAGDFSSNLVVDKDHVLGVKLDDSITLVDEEKFNTVFKMPVQNVSFNLVLPSLPAIPEGTPIPIPQQYNSLKFDMSMPSGERIDSVIFAWGSVKVDLTTDGKLSDVEVVIPQIVNLITKQSLRVKLGKEVILNKTYAFIPTQSATENNGVTLIFSGHVPYHKKIAGNIVMAFDGLQYAMGYFGRKEIKSPSITISTTAEFNEFADMIDYLYFAEPTIDFDIYNQYDAPMLLTIDTLEISGQTVLLSDGYNQFFVGAKQKTQLSISNKNTVGGDQLSKLINKSFKEFKVKIHAIMNPTVAEVGAMSDGYVQPIYNKFSVKDSVFGTYAMGLPLNCVLENLHFEQQLDIDLSSIVGDGNTLNQFAFAFTGKNYMPFDIAIDACVRENDDPKGAKTMLFETPIIIPSSLSVNVFDAVPSVIDGSNRQIVDIKPETLDKMTGSKKLFLDLKMSTKDATGRKNAKIFSPSSIELSVQVGAKIDFMTGKK